MIGDGEVQPEQADDGADQPFGLPERRSEDGSQGQRRQDCQRRVVGLPAPGRTWLGLPRLDGFIGEPDCQAPALAEAGVVLTPVRYLALLPGNMLATVLVQLEGHAGHPGVGERSSCYSGSTCSATGRIRATTPLRHAYSGGPARSSPASVCAETRQAALVRSPVAGPTRCWTALSCLGEQMHGAEPHP